VSLSVADDGVGIAEAGAAEGEAGGDRGHLGLRLLADRVTDIGGELRVRSQRTGGTVVEAAVPLRPGSRDVALRTF
jgi:signal transduction histidine kinase